MADTIKDRSGRVLGCIHTGGWGLCSECEHCGQTFNADDPVTHRAARGHWPEAEGVPIRSHFADQRAHEVAWQTAAERNALGLDAMTVEQYRPRFDPNDCGGVFDGVGAVFSDADPGL